MIILNKEERAYLAGFFDGEGCITIVSQKARAAGRSKEYYLLVLLSQSNKPFLVDWCKRVGVGRIYTMRRAGVDNRGVKCNKTQYKWQISGKQAILFLREIYDYLIIKKSQADVAFEFQETRKRRGPVKTPQDVLDKRQQYMDELKRIKKEIGKES